MERKLNWKMITVFFLFIAVLGVTLFTLRAWRRTLTAKNSLQSGMQAYEQQQWPQAVKEFGRYIAANPQDIPVLHK